MPKVTDIFGYQIYFFSGEGNEPCHVHISKDRSSSSKVWIVPTVELAHNKADIPKKDLRRILEWCEANAENILQDWKNFFKS